MAHEHEGKNMLFKKPGDATKFKHAQTPLGKDMRETIDDPQPLNQQGGTSDQPGADDDAE